CRVFLGVGDIFLGVLDGLIENRLVELDEVDGRLGENGEPLRPDLGEAAPHEIAPALGAAGGDFEQARTQARKERGVIGEHGEVALGPRHQDLLDLAGDEQPLRRDQLELEGVGHDYATSAASFSALATASSMVPTM